MSHASRINENCGHQIDLDTPINTGKLRDGTAMHTQQCAPAVQSRIGGGTKTVPVPAKRTPIGTGYDSNFVCRSPPFQIDFVVRRNISNILIKYVMFLSTGKNATGCVDTG